MAYPLLAGAYYALALAGSVSLGKAMLSLSSGGPGGEDERSTGYAAVVGGAVVAGALLADLAASGLDAVSSSQGIFAPALLACAVLGYGVCRKFLVAPQAPSFKRQGPTMWEQEMEREERVFSGEGEVKMPSSNEEDWAG